MNITATPIIITTLQKFPFLTEKIGALPAQRYAVIVDEAHSSQAGEQAAELKGILNDAALRAKAKALAQEEGNGDDDSDAEALLRMGQGELAVAQLQPLVRSMPGNREAARLLGEAQLASGDAHGALETLRPLALSAAFRPEELALAIKAAKAAGDPGLGALEARSRAPAAQALGRDLADGDIAMRAGNWAGAVQAYERVLALTDGRNPVVLNNMAYAQTMLGNHDAAIGFATRAMKEAPNNASVLDTAGWAWFKSGKDIGEARRLLRRAAQLAPQNATIRAHLAEAERAPN